MGEVISFNEFLYNRLKKQLEEVQCLPIFSRCIETEKLRQRIPRNLGSEASSWQALFIKSGV